MPRYKFYFNDGVTDEADGKHAVDALLKTYQAQLPDRMKDVEFHQDITEKEIKFKWDNDARKWYQPVTEIKVDDVRTFANNFLRQSNNDNIKEREGVISLLEDVLHFTKNYEGFRYLNPDDMRDAPIGADTVGIQRQDGEPQDSWFKNTDSTRRCYY